MFIVIKQSTDSRDNNYILQKFSSLKSAEKWIEKQTCGFAYPAAADNSLPVTQQNYHKLICTIYEMPLNWRMPSRKQLEKGLYEPWRYSDKKLQLGAIHAAGKIVS